MCTLLIFKMLFIDFFLVGEAMKRKKKRKKKNSRQHLSERLRDLLNRIPQLLLRIFCLVDCDWLSISQHAFLCYYEIRSIFKLLEYSDSRMCLLEGSIVMPIGVFS